MASKVFPSEITRAATALQVAIYEYTGEIRGNLSDEDALKAIATCSATISAMCKAYIKQEGD